MKIFLCECKKMMSFRIFWIIFVCLFAINGYVQIDRINDRYYTPESYRSFFSETKDMSLEEIQDYTNEMLERQNNGEYIEFPMMLVYDMSELSKECENYPEYLNSIKEQTNNMSAVSIWGDSDTFSYRNIQKHHRHMKIYRQSHCRSLLHLVWRIHLQVRLQTLWEYFWCFLLYAELFLKTVNTA